MGGPRVTRSPCAQVAVAMHPMEVQQGAGPETPRGRGMSHRAPAGRGTSHERGADQRREPRVPLDMPVRIATIDAELDPGTGRRFFRSSHETCANVSRTGLFIRTAEPLEPGRRLLVELTLPGGKDIDAVGRVAWVRRSMAPPAERGVGIELLGATPEELARLRTWIASRTGADVKPHERSARAHDENGTPFSWDAAAPTRDGESPEGDGFG